MICGNREKITTSFITDSLNKYGFEDIVISGLKIEKLDGGYLGEVLRVLISYNEKGESDPPDSVVCKFHPTRFFDMKLHVRETMFFVSFTNENLFPFFPKYYNSILDLKSGEGCIVMEDLCQMDIHPFEFGLDVEQTKMIFDSLAKFHSHTWNRKEYVLEVFRKYGLKIAEKGEKMLLESLFKKYVSNESKMKEISEEVQENMRLCSEHLSQIMSSIYKKVKHRSVTHSDLWNNNILFPVRDSNESSDSGSSKRLKILDFQFCDYSIPQEDLVFLLYSSLECSLVKEKEKELVGYYYHKLMKYLHELDEGKEGRNKVEYSKEEFFRDYEFCKIYGVVFTLASDEVFDENTKNRLLHANNSFFCSANFKKFYKDVLG